jgi:hypothetical protein
MPAMGRLVLVAGAMQVGVASWHMQIARSGSRCQVPGARRHVLAQEAGCQVHMTGARRYRSRVPGTRRNRSRVTCASARSWVPGARCLVLAARCLVPGARFQVPCTTCHVRFLVLNNDKFHVNSST